jgi:NAD(P)-dependent dehydrogenase (short-subunit alcohol dehydrogenase family)
MSQQLESQGTLVVAVLPGMIDTEMVAGLDYPKVSAESIVGALRAVGEGRGDLFGPEIWDPEGWGKRFYTDPKTVEREDANLDKLVPAP